MYHDFNYRGDARIVAARSMAARRRSARRSGPRFLAQLHAREPGPDGRARHRSTRSSSASSTRSARINICRIFGIVEEFILPFLLDHARPHLLGDDWRVRAILNFASEEAKHIHLFKRFHAGVRARLPGRVPGDRPVRSDRRRSASPRPARGRARDPDDRVDDPAALSRFDPRRRRPRSAVQEPDEASLDGGSAARQARHA